MVLFTMKEIQVKDALTMSISKHVQTILNGTIYSLKAIIPTDINVKSPSIVLEPYEQRSMGVLIGIVGNLKGRIIIDSTPETFGAIGTKMFGMPLEGEMLESFTGELGNMIAGNLCTYAGQNSLELDITPPTVMVGHTKLFGFQNAFRLEADLSEIGKLTILLAVEG